MINWNLFLQQKKVYDVSSKVHIVQLLRIMIYAKIVSLSPTSKPIGADSVPSSGLDFQTWSLFQKQNTFYHHR